MLSRPLSWRDGDEARHILSRLGRNPPAREMRSVRGLTDYYQEVYVGKAVARLKRLFSEFGNKVVDTPDADAWYADSVEKAISDAIADARLRRAA